MQIKSKVSMHLLSVYIIWGSTYYAIKVSIEAMPPYLMLSVRFFTASLILGAYCYLRKLKFPHSALVYIKELVVGFLLLVGGLGSVALAEKWIDSSMAAIVIATVPLWLLLLSSLFDKSKPKKVEIILMLFGFSGVVVLNYYELKEYNSLAIILCLIAPFSWSVGSIIQKKLSDKQFYKIDTLVSSCIQMFFASLLFLLMYCIFETEKYINFTFYSSLAIVYLITFGSIIAFSSYIFLCNQNISSAVLGSYAYINPVVAVVIGVFLGGENITVSGYIAISIILISVLLLSYYSKASER